MKKLSFLIVCLGLGLTFLCQAQDNKGAPSLNGGRPSPWERPIGPGPKPIIANGGSGNVTVTGDDDTGGSLLDGLVKGSVKPGSEPNVSQAPSLNGGRPTPWDRPIGPGPKPIIANGGSGNVTVTDDDDTGGSPLDDLTKATVRPGTNPNVAMGKCSGSSGSPMVYDVTEVLVGGFASVPDVNGDGKIDVNDFDAMFDLLLNEQ